MTYETIKQSGVKFLKEAGKAVSIAAGIGLIGLTLGTVGVGIAKLEERRADKQIISTTYKEIPNCKIVDLNYSYDYAKYVTSSGKMGNVDVGLATERIIAAKLQDNIAVSATLEEKTEVYQQRTKSGFGDYSTELLTNQWLKIKSLE
jgi:hypothetical protein